jgi:anti-anti-sigma regulatory factor
MLITLNRKVMAFCGRLMIRNVSPKVREVFEITKLDKLFPIE